ncbi:TonB-dependent siderophore receptor [plant metagenome]
MNHHITQHTSAATRSNRLGSSLNALAISLALAFGLSPEATYAQSTTPTQINIPAQSLNQALLQLGQQTDIQIYYLPETVANLNAPAVAGTLTAEQALAQLLRGTGVDVRWNGKTASLSKPASGGATQLAPVLVTGSVDPTTEGTGSYTTPVTNSATKLNLSIRETPQSISVITRQRMDDQALTDMVGVLEQTPGVTVNQTNGHRFTVFSRGDEITRYQIDGVSTNLMNIAQFSPQSQLDMALYDRVEVVRGATGLLTGAGAPSGVVNVVRKRPTKEFQASIQAGVGSWDDYRAEGDIAGPLSENGRVRGRLVAVKHDKNSFTDSYGQDKSIFYGAIEADLTDSTLLRLGMDYQKVKWHGGGGVPLMYNDGTQTNFSRSTGVAPRWSSAEFETYTYTLNFEQKLARGWEFKIASNYMDSRRHESGVEYAANAMNYVIKEKNQAWQVDQTNLAADQKQKGIDITLQGPFKLFGREHQAIVGFNFADYENTHIGLGEDTVNNIGLSDIKDVPGIPKVHTYTMYHKDQQRGYYGALRLNPIDRLHVIVGARSSDNHYKYHYGLADGTWSTSTNYSKRGEVTPYAGIVFDLTPQQSIYASYTDIFQPNSVVDSGRNILDPQVGSNYELGWKGEFYDGRLNANVAVYQVERDNVPEYVGTVDGIDTYRAVSGVKTKGIDVELAGELLPQWHMSASYNYSASEDKDGVRQFTHRPLNTFRLFTTYQLSDKLTIGGGASWNSKTFIDYPRVNNGMARQGSYYVINAMARYKFNKSLSASLNINNLLDRKYYSSIARVGYGYYGAPRNAFLNIRYDF